MKGAGIDAARKTPEIVMSAGENDREGGLTVKGLPSCNCGVGLLPDPWPNP